MSQFHVNQIETRIRDLFQDTDWQIALTDAANLSRCLAKYALKLRFEDAESNQTIIEITDGSADRGIDAVGVDKTAKLVTLVQSKWRRDGSGSMALADVLKFLDGVRSVLGMSAADPGHSLSGETKRAVNELLRTPGARVSLVTVTTANEQLAAEVARPIKDLLAQLNDVEDVDPLATHEHLGQRELFKSLTVDPMASVELTLQMLDWGRSTEPQKMYYGRVSAADVAQWHAQHGNALFAENIRVLIPRSDINDGIARTIVQEPERLLYYNNGITVIAEDIAPSVAGALNRDSGYFHLRGASVVNGAQTLSTLASLLGTELEANLGRAQIVVRCIEVPDEEDELGRRITRFANTQNDVSSQDFAYLDPEQHRLAKELGVLGVEYLLRSSGQATNRDMATVIELREAAVALACSARDLTLAVVAKREVSRLFADNNVYKLLFNPATDPVRLLRSVQVLRCVNRHLDEVEANSDGVRNGIAVHGRTVIAHLALRALDQKALEAQTEDSFADGLASVTHHVATFTDSLESVFPDKSYPGNVFKNQGRIAQLLYDAGLSQAGAGRSRPEAVAQDTLFSWLEG